MQERINKIKADATLTDKEKEFAIGILTQMDELTKGIAEKSADKGEMQKEFDALKKQISEINVKSVQEQVDNLTKSMEEMKLKNISPETKSFAVELKEQLNKEIETLKKMAGGAKGERIALQVKAFLETANASITTGSLQPIPQFEMGISKEPDRNPFLLNIITTGIASSQTIYWTQRKTRTDNSGFVTEGTLTTLAGGTVTESVLGYETKSASMQNLTEFIKVSNNSLDDLDWILSEVQTELMTLMALKIDAAILNGTVAVNGFDGILGKATAFHAGGDTLATGVTPNRFDALVFALNQIQVANFTPNYIVLHPSDVRDMKLTRDDNGTYIIPPTMATGSNVAVDGVRIIANTGMTKGTYLVGDFSRAKFWLRKGLEINIWEQNEDDATKQLKTITAYMRGTLVIKDADTKAFVTDTFADTITEITHV